MCLPASALKPASWKPKFKQTTNPLKAKLYGTQNCDGLDRSPAAWRADSAWIHLLADRVGHRASGPGKSSSGGRDQCRHFQRHHWIARDRSPSRQPGGSHCGRSIRHSAGRIARRGNHRIFRRRSAAAGHSAKPNPPGHPSRTRNAVEQQPCAIPHQWRVRKKCGQPPLNTPSIRKRRSVVRISLRGAIAERRGRVTPHSEEPAHRLVSLEC